MVDPGGAEFPNEAVLIVDDDPAVCSALAFALTTDGFAVQTFASAAEILAQTQYPARGCVIIDFYLPGMNGLQLAVALRERGVALPVILITTHPTRSLRQSAAAEGIEIVEKPLLGNSLTESIRAAFRTHKPQGK